MEAAEKRARRFAMERDSLTTCTLGRSRAWLSRRKSECQAGPRGSSWFRPGMNEKRRPEPSCSERSGHDPATTYSRGTFRPTTIGG